MLNIRTLGELLQGDLIEREYENKAFNSDHYAPLATPKAGQALLIAKFCLLFIVFL